MRGFLCPEGSRGFHCIPPNLRGTVWGKGDFEGWFTPHFSFEVWFVHLKAAWLCGFWAIGLPHMSAKLTDIAIRNAKPRPKKYKLSGGRGLTLIVMPDGAKYWRLRYRFAGKEKELAIGRPYPELSLKGAETEADRLRQSLAAGLDPSEERFQEKLERNTRASSFFGDAAEAWIEFRGRAWAERTKRQVREYMDKDLLPALSHRLLASITTKELAALTRKMEERGAPDVAKKTRQWLASIFSYARGNGWVQTDPVRDLRALVHSDGEHKYKIRFTGAL